ncbi:acid sphingomyelinase-like phosphodiesterase 3b isoform X2 [Tigriopus californicus]|uniref:acid sphingomyelinase-like phosphodiesterase 3b isoform X2 n=1 Tax=Tigriopus californicus TaxID=6832 RepID=UPI0027DA222C|nr:acid sphingomyelinase-like phosphodiesterase 3b isoform X2 [Tigriopus californicus]
MKESSLSRLPWGYLWREEMHYIPTSRIGLDKAIDVIFMLSTDVISTTTILLNDLDMSFSCKICGLFILSSLITTVWTGGIGYFWHVSDLHLDVNFTIQDPNVLLNVPHSENNRDYYLGEYDYETCWEKGGSGKYGDYNCDSSLELVKSAMNFIKAHSDTLGNDVKFILWTGDDTSHAENEHFDEDLVVHVMGILTEQLKGTGIQVYPVLGNHDFHPKNQAPNNPAGLIYQESADLWKQWLVGEPIAEYKANGGFYQVGPDAQQHLPFKLIALNTNIYKLKNHFTEGIQDPLGQFEWLESLLKKAESDQTKVILFAHIPPGKFERFYQYMEEEDQYGFHWFTPTFNQKYLELLDKYSHVISAQFYGHHHTDALKMISANNGTPTSFGLLAPAVTPWISTLAPETGGNNPGLRLFKYDMDTGEILDYDQFWLNLAKANADNVPEWKMEYSFLEYYGLQGTIDLNLMLELTKKIRDDVQTFERYYSANSVQFDTDCDQTCRRYHLCAIFEQDYSQFEDCVSNSSRNLSSNTSTYIFLFFLYTLPNCRQWT